MDFEAMRKREKVPEKLTFSELEMMSDELTKLSRVVSERNKPIEHMAKVALEWSEELDGMVKVAPKLRSDVDKGLAAMGLSLKEVLSKSPEMRDYAERMTKGLQESLGEMDKILLVNAERMEEEAKEVKKESVELSNLAKGLTFLASGLEEKGVELRQRLRALKMMVCDEFTELRLCKFEWASEADASDGIIAISRFKLADEAKAIAESSKKILNDPHHVELCKDIPVHTMTDAYRRERDTFVKYFASPKMFLEETKPYKDHKKSLEESQQLHHHLATEFKENVSAHFQAQEIEGDKKVVMVRDDEEYKQVMTETSRGQLAKPDFLIIPALPENLNPLSKAIKEGNDVLLYLKRDKKKG